MKHPKAMYTNKAEIAVLKLVGSRLYAAREAANLTQRQAAKLLGTSKQAVQDAERGLLNPMPLKLLKGAAELCSVTADWILGISDDWDRDSESIKNRDFLACLHKNHIRHYSELVARQEQSERINDQAVSVIAEIIEAFDKFQTLNPSFEDLLGGATLLRAINSAKAINPRLIHRNTGKQQVKAQ